MPKDIMELVRSGGVSVLLMFIITLSGDFPFYLQWHQWFACLLGVALATLRHHLSSPCGSITWALTSCHCCHGKLKYVAPSWKGKMFFRHHRITVAGLALPPAFICTVRSSRSHQISELCHNSKSSVVRPNNTAPAPSPKRYKVVLSVVIRLIETFYLRPTIDHFLCVPFGIYWLPIFQCEKENLAKQPLTSKLLAILCANFICNKISGIVEMAYQAFNA